MNNKILTILITIFIGILAISTFDIAQAQSPTPSDEPTPSETTTQNLRERIEKVVKEKQHQIKGVIDNISFQKQGFVGQLERLNEESLTVKTTSGTRIIPINEEVTFVKNSKNIKVADLAVDNWLVVMGYLEDDTFSPKRILVSTTTLRPKSYTVQLGSIQEISKSEITFLPRSDGEPIEIALSKSSKYQDIDGQKILKTNLSKDLQALVIHYNDDGDHILKTIRLLSILDL